MLKSAHLCTNASASYCTENSVATLTSVAFTSHWDAYDGLSCLEEHFIDAGDRRAIFASVYTLTTLRIAESIDAGDYQDTEWIYSPTTKFPVGYSRENSTRARRQHTPFLTRLRGRLSSFSSLRKAMLVDPFDVVVL